MKFLSGEIASMVAGQCIGPDHYIVNRYTMNSKEAQEHDVFLAYTGERFNAHQFVEDVIANGCKVVIVDQHYPIRHPDVSYIVVNDTNQAMLQFANAYRKTFTFPVIAITGSNGKTTTKDTLKKILSCFGNPVVTSENNNNEIGVAQTIFKADETTDYLVLEAGIDHEKDMEILSRMIEPDISVLVSVGLSHIDAFKSIENLARHKVDLVKYADPRGTFIYQGDMEVVRTAAKQRNYAGRMISFGFRADCDYRISEVQLDENGESFVVNDTRVHTNLIGDFQASNITAAMIVADVLGLPLAEYQSILNEIEITRMRLQLVKVKEATIIMDAYKSNPDSARGALNILDNMKAKSKAVVLGGMYGLDAISLAAHREILERLKQSEVDVILLFGTEFEQALSHFPDKDERFQLFHDFNDLQQAFQRLLDKPRLILIKGSRLYKLERLLEDITQ